MSPTARILLVGWNARSNARFFSEMGWYSIATLPSASSLLRHSLAHTLVRSLGLAKGWLVASKGLTTSAVLSWNFCPHSFEAWEWVTNWLQNRVAA